MRDLAMLTLWSSPPLSSATLKSNLCSNPKAASLSRATSSAASLEVSVQSLGIATFSTAVSCGMRY